MDITKDEEFALLIMRANASRRIIGVRKAWRIGRLHVKFEWRSKKNRMGRFGGGWNWKLGMQAGGSTMIVSLLVCDIRAYVT